MKNRLTLQLEAAQVADLVLGNPKAMNIDLPTTTGQRARAIVDTTAHWSAKTSYIPIRGEIIVYSDHSVIDDVCYPAIKIGDGSTYVVDLPFVGDDVAMQIMDALSGHIANQSVHITDAERRYWNNKLDSALSGENLILAPAILDNDLLEP